MARDWKTAYAAMHAAGEAVFPPACLHYVLDLCRGVFQERAGRAMDPGELIEAFRKKTARDFGPLAETVLTDWGLGMGADLGRAVLLLGRHGCLNLGPGDTLEVFAADERPLAHA